MNQLLLNKLTFFFICFLLSLVLDGQESQITFKLNNYDSEELIIGYYYADKTLILDTLERNDQEEFILDRTDTLQAGVYIALTLPDKKFFQFYINDDEKEFSVVADANDFSYPQFIASKDNTLFYDYMKFLSKQRPIAQRLNDSIDSLKVKDMDYRKEQDSLDEINQKVVDKQQAIIAENPDFVSSFLIRANLPLDVPEFSGPEDSVQLKKYLWFKEHYFDNFDLSAPLSLRTPLMAEKVNYYLEKLTALHPDSIKVSVDFLLERMRPAPESFRYYLSFFLNKYASSKYIGFDAIYVHIVEKYYEKGDAPWVSEQNLKKIVNNARRIKPLLIGKIAPDFTVYKEDKTPVTLSEIDADYVVLVFWAPECGHCEKAMPHIIEFEKNFRDQGVQLISICNKTGKKYEDCWKAVKEKGMESLLNVGDQYQRSRILINYYIRNTPMIYVLDKNREILLKKVAAEKLVESMEQIMKTKGEL